MLFYCVQAYIGSQNSWHLNVRFYQLEFLLNFSFRSYIWLSNKVLFYCYLPTNWAKILKNKHIIHKHSKHLTCFNIKFHLSHNSSIFLQHFLNLQICKYNRFSVSDARDRIMGSYGDSERSTQQEEQSFNFIQDHICVYSSFLSP